MKRCTKYKDVKFNCCQCMKLFDNPLGLWEYSENEYYCDNCVDFCKECNNKYPKNTFVECHKCDMKVGCSDECEDFDCFVEFSDEIIICKTCHLDGLNLECFICEKNSKSGLLNNGLFICKNCQKNYV